MKLSPRLRWACYAIAAVATGVAMWQVDRGADDGAVQPVRAIRRGTTPPLFSTGPAAAPEPLDVLKRRLDAAISGQADPFSDAGRVTAVAPPAPAQERAVAAPAAPAAPVVPYVYIGRWQEQGESVVFLQGGDRVLSVRGPGPLDGRYVVEAVGPQSLTLKSVAGTERFTIPFAPATASAGPGAPAPSAPTTTAASPAGAPEEN